MINSIKKFVLPVLAVVVIIIIFIMSNKETKVETTSPKSLSLANYEVGDSFVIPISELKNDVKFYSLNYNGANVEILAAIDKNGNPKVTLNTCQNCMGSPNAFFVQEGDSVVCQNCGIGHQIETIGTAKRGCNPIPIDSLVIDDKNISFDKNELLSNAGLFITIEK